MRPTPVRIKGQENPVLAGVSSNSNPDCIFVQPRRLYWKVVNQKSRDVFWRHVQLGPGSLPVILFTHVHIVSQLDLTPYTLTTKSISTCSQKIGGLLCAVRSMAWRRCGKLDAKVVAVSTEVSDPRTHSSCPFRSATSHYGP